MQEQQAPSGAALTVNAVSRYFIRRLDNDLGEHWVSYDTPNGDTAEFDLAGCIRDNWCYDSSAHNICYYNYSDPTVDDRLEFTLDGIPGAATCTLAARRNTAALGKPYFLMRPSTSAPGITAVSSCSRPTSTATRQ